MTNFYGTTSRLAPIDIKMAKIKALNTEADELACFLSALDGHDEPTLEDLKLVWSLPRYNKEARARLWAERINLLP